MTTTPDPTAPMFDITRRQGPAPTAGGCCGGGTPAAPAAPDATSASGCGGAPQATTPSPATPPSDSTAQGGGCCGPEQPEAGDCCG